MEKYLAKIKKMAQYMLEHDGFEEAARFARFIESRNDIVVHTLSAKLKRIFTSEELDMVAETIRSVTNRYIPPKIAHPDLTREDFSSHGMPNVIPFPKSPRN